MKKAVFLDRDGVIVKNINGEAPTRVSALELLPQIISIIFKLQKQKYEIIIISNQPDVAMGAITEQTKNELIKKFEKLLKENNISVDGIYYCFHHPQGIIKKYAEDCNCRKPRPGMLLKAISDHNIDPKKSFFIGDRATDVKAGNLVGVQTILFDPNDSEKNYLLEYKVKPDFIIKKLPEVMKIIKDES